MSVTKCKRIALNTYNFVNVVNTSIVIDETTSGSTHSHTQTRNGRDVIEGELVMRDSLVQGPRMVDHHHNQKRRHELEKEEEEHELDVGDAFTRRRKGRPSEERKYTRAPSNYNLFVASVMEEAKQANPGKKTREMMKFCARMWRALKAASSGDPNQTVQTVQAVPTTQQLIMLARAEESLEKS